MDIYDKIIVGAIVCGIGLCSAVVGCSKDEDTSRKKATPSLPSHFVKVEETTFSDWYGVQTIRNDTDHVTCYVAWFGNDRGGFQCMKDEK